MLVVLVNGLPGSGKSTLANSLANALDLPLFSKDSIKETLADTLDTSPPPGYTQRSWSQALGAAAGETLWTLLGEARPGAIAESPFLRHLRSIVAAGLKRAHVDEVHEVWCHAPLDVARQRYEKRAAARHPIHDDARVDDAQWNDWATHAEPLAFGPVYRVDPTGPVDLDQLVAQLRA